MNKRYAEYAFYPTTTYTSLPSSVIPAEKLVETEDGRILLVAAPRKAKSLYCQGIDEK